MKKANKEHRNNVEITPYARLQSLAVHSEKIFHFPEGLPAFEYIKEFVFLFKPKTAPFLYMQALEPADISFICIDPFLIYPNYKPRLSDRDVSFLHLNKAEDVLMLSIVTIRESVTEITANLQGPITINMQASLGKQIICENQKYPVRYKIWDSLNQMGHKDQKKDQVKQVKKVIADAEF
jgi:flagellar assembly factor FliW